MFNETTDQPVHLFANPCPAGQVQDYDPETRTFLPGCVDETAAYQAGGYPTGGARTAKPDNTWLWIGMGAVVFIAFAFGGRR